MYFGPDQRVTMQDIEKRQFYSIKEQEKEKFKPKEIERKQIQQFKEAEEIKEKIKRKN